MSVIMRLIPIDAGDPLLLPDVTAGPGEAVVVVTVSDDCADKEGIWWAIQDAVLQSDQTPPGALIFGDLDDVADWCLGQWALAQATMPPRKPEGSEETDSDRYLDCRVMARWVVEK